MNYANTSIHGFINPAFCRMFNTMVGEFNITPDALSQLIGATTMNILLGGRMNLPEMFGRMATERGVVIDPVSVDRICYSIDQMAETLSTYVANLVNVNDLDYINSTQVRCFLDTVTITLSMRFSDA